MSYVNMLDSLDDLYHMEDENVNETADNMDGYDFRYFNPLISSFSGKQGATITGKGMSLEKFPEKFEVTPMYMDPNIVDKHIRDALRDRSPDKPLFEEELPRRDTGADWKLNVRHGGRRTNTQPWMNPEFNTQIMTHDPRGWSGQIPFDEGRRIMDSKMSRQPFVDDTDPSVPDKTYSDPQRVHDMKHSLTYAKANYKNFDSSILNQRRGRVQSYRHESLPAKYDTENWYDIMDNITNNERIVDNATSLISNMGHAGSKHLIENSRTSHKFKVASYGLLFKQKGLDYAESQVRQVSPSHKIKRPTKSNMNKKIDIMMSNRINGMTSDQASRQLRKLGESPMAQQKYGKYNTMQQNNTNGHIDTDITAMLGLSEQSIKKLQSQAQQNNKKAKKELANVIEMVESIEQLPLIEKTRLRDYLLYSGQTPKNTRKGLYETKINPKLIQFMEQQTKKTKQKEDTSKNRSIDDRKKLKSLSAYTKKSKTVGDTVMLQKQSKQDHLVNTLDTKAVNYRNRVMRTKADNRMQNFDSNMGDSYHVYNKNNNIDYNSKEAFNNSRRGIEFNTDKINPNKSLSMGMKYIPHEKVAEFNNTETEMNPRKTKWF